MYTSDDYRATLEIPESELIENIVTQRLPEKLALSVEERQFDKDAVWILELAIESTKDHVFFEIQRGVTLGRKIAEDYSQPHIDLTAQGAEEKGVSRIHAAIYARHNGLSLQDLGSTNGTHVNGQQTEPYIDLPLLVNDIIELGSLRLRVQQIIRQPLY